MQDSKQLSVYQHFHHINLIRLSYCVPYAHMCLHLAAVPSDMLKRVWTMFKTFNIIKSFSDISFTKC